MRRRGMALAVAVESARRTSSRLLFEYAEGSGRSRVVTPANTKRNLVI
jgi:hypothetical protein